MGNLAELIGKRLKQIRKEKGLKQEEMENFGISYKYYQRIENGKVNVTLKTLEKVASAFDIDVTELFNLPLHHSEEVNELNTAIQKLLGKNNKKAIKKLIFFIREIL